MKTTRPAKTLATSHKGLDEIDAIFLKKPPQLNTTPEETSATGSSTSQHNKKKRKKKSNGEKLNSQPKVSSEVIHIEEKEETVIIANMGVTNMGDTAVTHSSKWKRNGKELEGNDGFTDSRGTKTSQYTEDGLPIFTVQDLNIGKGEDTNLCPFDCNCCCKW